MRNLARSVVVVGVLALTMTGCAENPNSADACRELLSIQGELDVLVNDVPSTEDDVRTVVPALVDLAEDAHSLDADGAIKVAATSLGVIAQDWGDALQTAAEDGALDDPVDADLAAGYVDAGVDVRNACNQFLP